MSIPTDTWTTIRTKRAVRDYDPRPARDIIHRVLDAGRLAGSARNLQPWRFILVRESATLQALSKCGRFASHQAGAAFAVVICTAADRRRWAAFDAGRAAQNMMLAGWDQGVGSCATGLHNEARTRQLLGIPEDYDIQVAIAFGYPAPSGEGPVRRFIRARVLGLQVRKPLHEIVYHERWGQREGRAH